MSTGLFSSIQALGGEVINEAARLVEDGRLPTYLWAEAASYTVYTLNRARSHLSLV